MVAGKSVIEVRFINNNRNKQAQTFTLDIKV